MNFLTLFLNYKDFHFYKDPGQIPYRFQKNHGFNSNIICIDDNQTLSVSEKYLNVIRIKKLNRNNKTRNTIIKYFLQNSKKYNVLNIFHFNWSSLLFGYIYKIINRKGFLYVKLDHCAYSTDYEWEDLWNHSILTKAKTINEYAKAFLIKHFFVKKVDLWSVEDQYSCDYYQNKYEFFKNKLIVSYNGHVYDLFPLVKPKSFNEKENLIITVGRLGTEPKASDILLQSLAKVGFNHNWKVYLVGNYEPEFKIYYDRFMADHPDLEGIVVLKGNLCKDELFKVYNDAKIFVLPSRYEGFANVFSEAMFFSNAIITTKHVSVRDLVTNIMGLIIDKDDIQNLARSIKYLMDNHSINEVYGNNAHDFAVQELDWDTIVNKLYNNMIINGLAV